MAQTPRGGHRDTQWVIQYRKIENLASVPHEETMWTRHSIALTGPAAQTTLAEMRVETFGLEWRAIRIETVQRVEDW